MIGAMALIIVLSVFNGFENLLESLYNSFDPDIKIESAEGKSFNLDQIPLQELREIEEIAAFSFTLEEKAILRYKEHEYVAVVKGVDSAFERITMIDSSMVRGYFFGSDPDRDMAVIGQGVAYYLSLGIEDQFHPLQIYIPKAGATMSLDPLDAFEVDYLYPVGIFSIQSDFDAQYILVPLEFLQSMLGRNGEYGALEIRLKDPEMLASVKSKIARILPHDLDMRDRYELHEFLYKIFKTEKWAIFFLFTLIIILAAFSIVGSLTMLVLEKNQDIETLAKLGMRQRSLRKIFLWEGIFINGAGALIGLILGGTICWLQMEFGWIRLGNEGSFVVDAYPVKLIWTDFFLILTLVMGIGLLASWIPLRLVRSES
jgi:lipoprotein-releasing system permease protein